MEDGAWFECWVANEGNRRLRYGTAPPEKAPEGFRKATGTGRRDRICGRTSASSLADFCLCFAFLTLLPSSSSVSSSLDDELTSPIPPMTSSLMNPI